MDHQQFALSFMDIKLVGRINERFMRQQNVLRRFGRSQTKIKTSPIMLQNTKQVYTAGVHECIRVFVWAIFPVQWISSHLWHSGSEILSCCSFDLLFPFCSGLLRLPLALTSRDCPHCGAEEHCVNLLRRRWAGCVAWGGSQASRRGFRDFSWNNSPNCSKGGGRWWGGEGVLVGFALSTINVWCDSWRDVTDWVRL